MKVALAFADRRLDLRADPPEETTELVPDLGLQILFEAMAAGDRQIRDVVPRVVLAPLESVDAVRYRQEILRDCFDHPDVVRALYHLAGETLERRRRVWGGVFHDSPSSVLFWAGDTMKVFIDALRQLQAVARADGRVFRSAAFRRLFDEIEAQLDEDYLARVADHVEQVQFRDGVSLSASLGPGSRGSHYVLRRSTRRTGWRSMIGLAEPGTYVYEINPRDQAGGQMLGDIRQEGIALAAAAIGRSADHITSYFTQLHGELAFYVGCLNLRERLDARGEPWCFPEPEPMGTERLSAQGLYDACLSLSLPSGERAVGNDLEADGKRLVVVTGANRGGKSTFIRSLGLGQLLMQAGMIVPAESFRADLRAGIFSHFKREEDASLRSGKLDEELGRMSGIVDRATPNSLVLMNESFASTNEREGSEIGRQVVTPLLEAGIKVAFVTHLFDLADSFRQAARRDALFLRAERLADGHRTFRVVPGEPLPTSHGQDTYRQVFQAASGMARGGTSAERTSAEAQA